MESGQPFHAILKSPLRFNIMAQFRTALVFAFFVCVPIQPENAAIGQSPLLPNGSFEEGQTVPTGWRLKGEGRWASGEAHHGKHWLTGSSESGATVWESDKVSIQPGAAYRLEGWLRVPTGEARIGADLLDEAGNVVERVETPAVQRLTSWRYVAVDWNAAKATAARVWFWTKGQAELDDVSLAAAAESFVANKSVDVGDQRGRIPFWGEERYDALLPGRRKGQFRLDSEVKHSGKSSMQLTATSDWYGFSSVAYPVPGWTDRMQISGWARCEPPATAQLLACWIDDAQKVLRIDNGPSIEGGEWKQITSLLSPPPPKAASVKLVAVAKRGSAWFDDFDILRLPSPQPAIRVLVDQIAYEKVGPKSAVIATNFFPRTGTAIKCEIVDSQAKGVWQGEAVCSGRISHDTANDWGWYFWRLNFGSFQEAGAYHIRVKVENASAESPPFVVGQGALVHETAQSAVDFFYIQRCGCDVPGWHKPCHLDDAKLPDGSHLDLTGGWHSAGDYNKLMYEHGDGGVVFALLELYDSTPKHFDRRDRDGSGMPDILKEAKWGAEFVAKMQIPETGGLRNHVQQGPRRNWTKWSAPDVHTDNKIGTRDDPVVQPGEGKSPLAIGGWARLSVLLDRRGIKNDFLARAERLWNHETKNKAESPYLLLSALELHRATGQTAYLNFSRRCAKGILASQVPSGRLRGAFGSYGQQQAAALAQFALSYPNDALVTPIKESLTRYIDFCVSTADNAFGLSKQKVGETDSFFPPDLGNNFEVLGRAWAAALCYRVTRDERALSYAVDHVDWVLGKNPLGLCMFEGKGTLNPPRYHHRYNMIPGRERGAVPGTIPNGFVRDMGLADRPGFDMSRGGNRSPSFRTSEPWLVHNLFYLLAASALNDAYSSGP